jgi:transposase
MKNSEVIRKAVFNMGGPKRASKVLNVSISTIGKWVRKGVIPNLDKAMEVSKASGFKLTLLRPRFEQE